jgi:hypothetical protein
MASTTATDGSIFPERRWHELYHAAIIELDSAKLAGRIAEARRAILDRAKEILTASRDEESSVPDWESPVRERRRRLGKNTEREWPIKGFS